MMTNYIIFLFVFCVVNGPATGAKENTDPLTELFNTDESIKFAGYGEDKLSTVLVTGNLLCHPLYQRPFPISGISFPRIRSPNTKYIRYIESKASKLYLHNVHIVGHTAIKLVNTNSHLSFYA